ncbi:MAG: PilZ domain-containing protein [Sphingomonadales bacterium]|nr:PilZ domain-containing protein [Sphingomonadales bacterium]
MVFPTPSANEAGQADPNGRMPRVSRLLSAECKSADGESFRLVVRNVSQSGLGGRCSIALRKGDRIEVTLPAMEAFMATVRWVAGERCGIAADVPIDLDQLKFHNPNGAFSTADDKDSTFELYRHKAATSYRPSLTSKRIEPKPSGFSEWNER